MSVREFRLGFALFVWRAVLLAIVSVAGIEFCSDALKTVRGPAPLVPPSGPPAPSTRGTTGSLQGDLLREVKMGIILAAADVCGVEPGLAIALGMRESGLVWPEKLHEARGIYQVKDSTARGVSKTLNNRTVWGNAVAGLCYLRQLRDREGSWEAALLSYREGPHRKATSREAHAYVADIMEGM